LAELIPRRESVNTDNR